MDAILKIKEAIIEDNKAFTALGYKPIFMAHKDARIAIIGQAPGLETQLKDAVFRDLSGDRLRSWLGVDETTFYDSNKFAVLPMDFYFPGKAKTGDKPPRKDFAQKWHPQLLACMPHIECIILIGMYANKYYLNEHMERNLTMTVKNFKNYLPEYFPLVHPSPLNQRWMAKNEWFEETVLPVLKERVKDILR